MKKVLTIFLVLAFALSAKAQQYNSGAGVKIGNVIMVSYKQFVSESLAIEFSSGFYLVDYQGLFNNLVAQYHIDTNVEGFQWFYGGGIGTRFSINRNEYGLAGSFGMEMSVPDLNVSFTFGFQPVIFLDFVGERNFAEQQYYLTGPATVSCRFLLN